MKTNKFLAISALLLLSMTLMACSVPFINIVRGSGVLATETREVSDFDSVQLNGSGKLLITEGEIASLSIEAEDNLLSSLTSSVVGNTLKLGYEDRFWQKTLLPTQTILYHLTVPNLEAVTLNGANSLEMESLTTDVLVITLNGAAQVKIDGLTAETLDVQLNGTGGVEISGVVTTQVLGIDGAGTIQNGNLMSSTTSIEANGLGIATVWATDSLNISFNGGGTLNYYGEPAIIQNINGAADINHLGAK
jgi:hypothetical protein